jgi:hypothetical protein
MANTVASFYQTLVAAASEASAVLVGTTKFLERVYRDYDTVAVSPGQTINIALPASATASVADAGVADYTLTDISFTTATLVFNQHPGFAYIVRDFEQFNSPSRIREIFLDGAIKGMAEYVNAQLAALATPANFNTYATLTSNQVKSIDQNTIATAMGNLATAKVPVDDMGNFFLTSHPAPYFNMATQTFWSANSQIGYQMAGDIRKSALLGEQFGFMSGYDQQMPGSSVAVTGTSVGVTSASANVTGVATAFTTQLVIGNWLYFASDPTGTAYQILSITSNTALVLTAPFVGTTNAATSGIVAQYTNLLYHRHAIALAVRPLPQPDGRVVDCMYMDYKGLPIRIQVGYNQLKNGYVVSLDAGYALGVIRKDHGQIIKS